MFLELPCQICKKTKMSPMNRIMNKTFNRILTNKTDNLRRMKKKIFKTIRRKK